MRGEIKRNMPLAKKLLPSMRAAGLAIINETATTDSVAQHIKEITALGYNGQIHKRFSGFVIGHVGVFDSSWKEMKASHAEVRASPRLIRLVGEVLVDWIVLEACRKLTFNENIWCDRDQFLGALPFVPPTFYLANARPYTPVADTFWALGYRYLMGEVNVLADSGKYDDIFDKFFLWRTYYKEPFHARRYGDFRSMDDYHQVRRAEREGYARNRVHEYQKCQISQWHDNARSARQDKDKRQEEINDLKKMSLSERLTSIANSNYSIDYYHPEYNREKWAEEFGRESVVSSLDEKSKDRLALKLYDKCYIGWDSVRGQLARDGFPKNIC